MVEPKTISANCRLRVAPFHIGHWDSKGDRSLACNSLSVQIDDELITPNENVKSPLLLPDQQLSGLLAASSYVWHAIIVDHAGNFQLSESIAHDSEDYNVMDESWKKIAGARSGLALMGQRTAASFKETNNVMTLATYVKNAVECVSAINKNHPKPRHNDKYLVTMISFNAYQGERIPAHFVANVNEIQQLEMTQYKYRGERELPPKKTVLDKNGNQNKFIL